MSVKLIIIILFYAGFAKADELVNTFWQITYPQKVSSYLHPTDSSIYADCEDYLNKLTSNKYSAEELNFFRFTPLKKSLSMRYEAFFQIEHAPIDVRYDSEFFTALSVPHVEVQSLTSDKINLNIASGSLTALMLDNNLEVGKGLILGNKILKIESRDLACDILHSKVKLSVNARYVISLTNDDFEIINQVYRQMEAVHLQVLSSNDSAELKSIKMASAYLKLFKNKIKATSAIKAVFDKDFAFSDDWRKVGFMPRQFYKEIEQNFLAVPR